MSEFTNTLEAPVDAPAEVPILTETEHVVFEEITRELGDSVLHTIEAKAVGDAEDGEDPVTYPDLEADSPDSDDKGDKPPVVSGG